MTAIIGMIIISGVFGAMAWVSFARHLFNKKSDKTYIAIVLIVGLIIRLIAASCYRGHETDMNCFTGWADNVFKNGLSQFYLSDGFHDYPPGYMYILYILGAVKNILSLNGPVLWIVLKLPAIAADLGMGYLAYKLTSKNFSKLAGTAIATLVVLNPAVILDSSIWGQVDSILGFFCVLAIYFASERKLNVSFFAFAVAFLIKPQALFFAPVLAFSFIDEYILTDKFNAKAFMKTILCAIAAVMLMLVLFMPFGNTPIHGIKVIIDQYITTIGQYNYMTVNAFNLYGAFGLNWAKLTPLISIISNVFIIAVVVFSGVVFFKNKGRDRYYLTSFILVFGIYMLSAKMHERYAFPSIFMLIMVLASVPSDKNALLYGLFSLSQFFNIAWVLFIYEDNPSKYFKSPVIIVASIINLVLFGWVCYQVCRKKNTESKPVRISNQSKEHRFRLSEKTVKIATIDICIMLAITIVYGCVAFYKLGDKYAPQTETSLRGNTVSIDLGKEQEISQTAFFLGARQLEPDRNIILSYLDNNGVSVYNDVIEDGSVFVWTVRENTAIKARYIEVSTNCEAKPSDPTNDVYVKELCFIGDDGNVITPVNTSDKGVDTLFDEQAYLNTEKSYMSGTYFDEIYHPRTAYEFLHHMSVYEWTHPPLGKVLMGIGIMIFGMVPFGWRFIGTLLGVVMVPIVYIMTRRCMKYRWLAVLGCVLFTFDFMHFTQTRLATIDTYVTLFIMLMYYYMYKYYTKSFYDTALYKTLIPLGISGIFFGLSVASKWTGLYAGVGLALIFFITLYYRYREYRYALSSPNGKTDGISHKHVIDSFARNTVITLLFCCVMFVIVPFAIYVISYIPYMATPSGEGLKTIFTNANSMLVYHSKTVANSTHSYSSHWYEWPIMYRPIWYFSNTLSNGMKQGISAFGNPAVWWIGIGATAYNIALAIIIPLKKKNYFNKNKYSYATMYSVIFAILCAISYFVGTGNEKLVRLFPCVLLYSTVIVGTFIIVLMFDKKIKTNSNSIPLFLLIGYFSSYMPWMLVTRTTYIYHYFPCVIFVVLMIVYSIKTFYDSAENKKAVIIGTLTYGLIAIGLFALFYPTLSGQPISLEFAEKYLKWFQSWVLVA